MVNSVQKGKRGERELASRLRELGLKASRGGLQFRGGEEQADVRMDLIHIECKRQERLDLHGAIRQAVRDCPKGKTPVVMHKKNLEDWVATVRVNDLREFAKRITKLFEEGDEVPSIPRTEEDENSPMYRRS